MTNQNSIRKPSRSGRYRKVLVDPKFLEPFAENLASIFHRLNIQRLTQKISDAEFVTYGLLVLLQIRSDNAFQFNRSNSGNFNQINPEMNSSNFLLSDFWLLVKKEKFNVNTSESSWENLFDQKLLNQNISVSQFLKKIRFRGIPDSARLALLQWLSNEYPLELHFHIPTTDEVFSLQKKGGRCVTFFKTADEIKMVHHERDVISFTIHDLIHAHEFYVDPQRTKQQIGFYYWIDSIQNHSLILQLRNESPEFAANWEYIVSDMNSYCGHLLKTLNAAIKINAINESGQKIWSTLVNDSAMSNDAKAVFLKINSPEWTTHDFLKLENIFENMRTDTQPF